jgi:flagellin
VLSLLLQVGAGVTITNAAIGPSTDASSGNFGAVQASTSTQGANHTYFSATSHGFTTGDRVQYGSTGSAIGGLTSGSDYYVIADTANTFRLASSSVNALAGSLVSLTNAGTGTQSVSSYDGGSTTVTNLAALTLDLSSTSSAATSLDSVSEQLQKINTEIANIGSYQSRLAYASSELRSRTETLQSAYSRIMSADVATESANLVRTQILQQSAASILAQANQAPALALQLLR